MEREKPNILVSACVEFKSCRYNGQCINSPEVRGLMEYVNFIPVCPEVAIGLPVPRDPIRLVQGSDKSVLLVDSENGKDYTSSMDQFIESFLNTLDTVDGVILKGRSPTCGIGNVRIYPSHGKVTQLHSKETGLFGRAVLERYPEAPIEDEGRLNNLSIREHFLTRLYTIHQFNQLTGTMGALVEFHSSSKYLMMAYNQHLLKEAGKLTANHDRLEPAQVYRRYRSLLTNMFSQPPKIQSTINVLQHLFGYVSKNLNAKEKSFFLESLERYRHKQIPLAGVTAQLQSWILRFDSPYLARQTFFQPFPEGLQSIFDSSKGRI